MELDVELLDVVLESSSKVVLLVSYAGMDDENSMMVSNNPRRIYALVRFSHTANALAVEDAIVVPYQSVSAIFTPPLPLWRLTLRFRHQVLVHPCTLGFNLFATAR
jgi:nuclear pore complex protein Nup133